MKKALALILVFALSAIAMSSCAVSGDISRYGVVDYMKNITPAQQTPETLDSTFRDAYADFALRLYGEVKKEKNTLISPLSVMLALAMTANGASGETLAQLEQTPVDMFTTVYIGNHNTRVLQGRMVTPRGYRV